jgi:hypothetical protein
VSTAPRRPNKRQAVIMVRKHPTEAWCVWMRDQYGEGEHGMMAFAQTIQTAIVIAERAARRMVTRPRDWDEVWIVIYRSARKATHHQVIYAIEPPLDAHPKHRSISHAPM